MCTDDALCDVCAALKALDWTNAAQMRVHRAEVDLYFAHAEGRRVDRDQKWAEHVAQVIPAAIERWRNAHPDNPLT